MNPSEENALFALPLEQFTDARNALSKRLKGEGDKDGAERIKALKKPSLPIWAVNQVAHTKPEHVVALLAGVERLRRAQQQALAGQGAHGLKDAQRVQRELIQTAVDAASQILTSSGHASEAVLVQVQSLLQAAPMASAQSLATLKAGMLQGPLEEGDATVGVPAVSLAPVPPPPPKVEGEERARQAVEVQRQKEERERAQKEVQEKAASLKAAKERAEAAARVSTAAERNAVDLEARAHRAAIALKSAEAQAKQADEDAQKARAQADHAKTELEAAQAALSALTA